MAGPREWAVTKLNSRYSPKGTRRQKSLIAGKRIALRLWENEPPYRGLRSSVGRNYETVGYVIAGRAELYLEGQRVVLEPGDSWVVPKGALHRYRILASFTAVEATALPAELDNSEKGEGAREEGCAGL